MKHPKPGFAYLRDGNKLLIIIMVSSGGGRSRVENSIRFMSSLSNMFARTPCSRSNHTEIAACPVRMDANQDHTSWYVDVPAIQSLESEEKTNTVKV
jgi:hypothetical protein